MNIVVLGHVCIDRNVSEHASYLGPGSPAMFLSKIFKQLPRSSTTIISSYGPDFLPFAQDVVIYPKKPVTRHTLLYENLTKGKKRTQKAFFSEEAKPVVISKDITGVLKQADILYIAPITPNFSPEYIQKITKIITKDCIVILSPQGYFRQFDNENNVLVREFSEADRILDFVDFIIVSEQDHPHMKKVAMDWAKKHAIVVIVTTGEQGADIYTKNNIISVSTIPVDEKDIVDSVGSGDIFSAGLGYWYKKTQDLVGSVEFANRLARSCLFFTSENIEIDFENIRASSIEEKT